MNNNLKGMRTYLCGAMDKSTDFGLGWRKSITPLLKERGVCVLDPSNKPLMVPNTSEQDPAYWAHKRKLKELGQFDEFTNLMKDVRANDLALVDASNYLTVKLDLHESPCGTYEELFWANRCKRPILIVCEAGKKNIPDWLFATCPHEMFFSTWKEYWGYLDYIDITPIHKIKHHNRWKFFRFD